MSETSADTTMTSSPHFFAQTARQYVGKTLAEIVLNGIDQNVLGQAQNFPAYIGESLGMSVLFCSSPSATASLEYYRDNSELGTLHTGQKYQGSYWPKTGDLVFIQTKDASSYKSQYSADAIGIVVEDTPFRGISARSVEIDSSGKVVEIDRSLRHIAFCWTPKWELCSGKTVSQGEVSYYYYYAPLYAGQELNDYNDPVLREVCNVNLLGQPVKERTGVPLSIINYTTGLWTIFELIRPIISPVVTVGGVGGSYDLSGLDNKIRIIIETGLTHGYNEAVGVGIAANVFHESSFNPAVFIRDHNASGQFAGMGGGICGWLNSTSDPDLQNYTDMVNWVSNGNQAAAQQDYGRQVEYIFYSLEYDGSVWAWTHLDEKLKKLPNTLEGAQKAAELFCRLYENPAKTETAVKVRRATAGEYWEKLTPIMSPGKYGIWTIPVKYTRIASRYGWRIHPVTGKRQFHHGIDLSAASGVPIVASRAGRVSVATYDSSAGNYVNIDHGDGFMTRYLHMTRYIVSVNQQVAEGQLIGFVGSTGLSTGPHLHFGIYVNGSTVNPEDHIKF